MIPPSEFDTTGTGHVGSPTGPYGLEGRWMTYDTPETKALDGIKTSQMKGTHLGLVLRSDYTMYLRGFIVHHSTRTLLHSRTTCIGLSGSQQQQQQQPQQQWLSWSDILGVVAGFASLGACSLLRKAIIYKWAKQWPRKVFGRIVHYSTRTFNESRTACIGLTRSIVHQSTCTFKVSRGSLFTRALVHSRNQERFVLVSRGSPATFTSIYISCITTPISR
jgi:hypothetical protein